MTVRLFQKVQIYESRPLFRSKLRALLDIESEGFFDFAKRGIARLDAHGGRAAR